MGATLLRKHTSKEYQKSDGSAHHATSDQFIAIDGLSVTGIPRRKSHGHCSASSKLQQLKRPNVAKTGLWLLVFRFREDLVWQFQLHCSFWNGTKFDLHISGCTVRQCGAQENDGLNCSSERLLKKDTETGPIRCTAKSPYGFNKLAKCFINKTKFLVSTKTMY